MMRKYPFVCGLIGASVASGIMWSAILIYPTYSGAVAFGLGLSCGLALLIIRIRRAFTYASHDLADFVRGKGKSKPVENPLMLDPFYRSIDAQITEAKARHKRVKHLYAKREHRVNELLGKKELA